MNLLRILAMALLALAAVPAAAQDLSALARLDAGASGMTDARRGLAVDLAISQPVPYRVFLLADPPRLVMDFREVDFGPAAPATIDRAKAVTAVAWGRFRPGWSRLVAELDGPYRVVTAEEVTEDTGAATIRLRLEPTDAASFAGTPAAPPGDLWALPPPAEVAAPKRRQTGDQPLFVVLDPGHGGIDPGAEGESTTEAEIVLTFSRELADLLRRDGMTVILTREEDVFVPLETRISVARAAGADLFLSIHADALQEGEATGATVYTLAEEAEDEAGARLAERHDRADLLAGVDLTRHDDEVAGVLMDLARTETQPRSERLAEAMKIAIAAADIKMHRQPRQSGAFSVLKAPDIPSVLLEIGFLSSAADRKRLADPEWRARTQRAILSALQAWAIADAAEARLIRQ